jgi:hypothetical protein
VNDEDQRAEEMHTWTAPELRSFLELIEDDKRKWFLGTRRLLVTDRLRGGATAL